MDLDEEHEADEADLIICDLIAMLKAHRISLTCALEITSERMSELYAVVEPAPIIH